MAPSAFAFCLLLLPLAASGYRLLLTHQRSKTMKSLQWLTPAMAAATLLWNANSSANRLTAYAFSTTLSPAAPATIHSIDNIPCHETVILISTLHQPITILEATLEGQDKLVDQVLMLEDERNQDTAANNIVENDPYGSVLWPAARTVSEHITHDTFFMTTTTANEEEQSKKPTLLELGTGTGLVALAASASNKYDSILATDYESVPLKLLDAAYLLNQDRLCTSTDTTTSTMTPIVTSLFDICNLSVPLPPADVVCAADILYEKSTGIALAKRCIEALERGGSRVVTGCSPGRPGRPAFLEELLRSLNPNKMKDVNFVDVEGTTCSGEKNSLICGEGSTSISVEPKKLLVALMDLKPDCLQK